MNTVTNNKPITSASGMTSIPMQTISGNVKRSAVGASQSPMYIEARKLLSKGGENVKMVQKAISLLSSIPATDSTYKDAQGLLNSAQKRLSALQR